MFNDTYKSIIEELTRKSRRELQRLSVSILKKGLVSNLTKSERELINKIDNFIGRSYFEEGFEWSTKEILEVCSELLNCKKNQILAQQFIKDATKQSASEKAQIKHMELRTFKISKMSASGKNSIRFNEESNKLVSNKIEGITSRSFDYVRTYDNITEYFLGKVVFSQGGHQNGVKSEIIDFLIRSKKYLETNPNSNLIFTALVDGNSLTNDDCENYKKYTTEKVRLMNCDNYQQFTS
jgi:predicted nucleic-acid-binding protein